jgi:hypothetical protein
VSEQIAAAGRVAVLGGTHAVEEWPSRAGRWGPSLVLLPSGPLRARLDDLTAEAMAVLGGGHWPSGGEGRAHVTVRALEPHDIRPLPPDRVARYAAAAERALAAVGPVTLDVAGTVVTTGGVVATAVSPDRSADELRLRLGQELGPDGWLEDGVFPSGRDPFWYVTLVHFAGPVAEPHALLDWIESQRARSLGRATFDAVHLCAWHFDGTAVAPMLLA